MLVRKYSSRQDAHTMKGTETVKGAAVSYLPACAHSAISFLNEAHVITCTYSIYTGGLWLKVSLFSKYRNLRERPESLFKLTLMVNGGSKTPHPNTVTGVDLQHNQHQEAECVCIRNSHTCAGVPVLKSHDAFAGHHEKINM